MPKLKLRSRPNFYFGNLSQAAPIYAREYLFLRRFSRAFWKLHLNLLLEDLRPKSENYAGSGWNTALAYFVGPTNYIWAYSEGKTSMQNHCANPECRKLLHNLQEGRLFVIDDPAQPETNSTLQPLSCYWLCAACGESARRPMQTFMPQGKPSIFEDHVSRASFTAPFMEPLPDHEQLVFEEQGFEACVSSGVLF